MRYTIVGARGFIGGTFMRTLHEHGVDAIGLSHAEALEHAGDLGDVIYASGVAWDANKRLGDAVRTHVDVPLALLGKELRSFTYISSTRIYGDAPFTHETTPARVRADDVYAATKAAGEVTVLSDSRPSMRVIRLSNVYGPSFNSGLMSSDFLRQAATNGVIDVRSSRESAKDHVSVEDVVALTLRIAESGRERIYNIGAGTNTNQGALLDCIAAVSGARVNVAAGSAAVVFAPIDTRRIREEFGFRARDILDDVPELWHAFEQRFARERQAVR